MKFLYSSFLFALIAVAIPIIIHLFNFRKFKKIYFPNVKFLREVKQETQSKSKLKHLLVLLCRILAITFLVFAFAQPYLPSANKQATMGDKTISIFIDNSFSMEAVSENGALLDVAKNKALEIVSAYKPTDKFQLLTNDFEGRHQRLVNKEEFVELLDELKISPSVKTISEIISRQVDVFNNTENTDKTAFIISDFQKTISDILEIKNDTSVKLNFVPLVSQKKNNLYIDSCWFASPVRQLNQTEELFVRIKNISENNYENIPIKLFINGFQKTPASFTIEPNATNIFKLSFSSKEAGLQQGVVRITDYPITKDDDFYFSFSVAENIAVMAVNEENESSYLNSIFGRDNFFVFNNVLEKQIDYSSFSNQKLIILNELKTISSGLSQELKRFIDKGGSVLIFPNSETDTSSYRIFLETMNANYFTKIDTTNTKVSALNLEHELFKNVFEKLPENLDLPEIQSHYKFSENIKTNEEYLIRLQNGDAFLSQYAVGKGKVYLCATPLKSAYSNFSKHAIFVPTIYKIALLSEPKNNLFYTIGKDETIEINQSAKGENLYHITNFPLFERGSGGVSFDIIPEHQIINGKNQLFIHNQIKEAGNYFLTNNNENLAGLAFNYDRKESDLKCWTAEELIAQSERAGFTNVSVINSQNTDLSKAISEIELGTRLWKLCIIFVLLFLGIEILLLKFWK